MVRRRKLSVVWEDLRAVKVSPQNGLGVHFCNSSAKTARPLHAVWLHLRVVMLPTCCFSPAVEIRKDHTCAGIKNRL